MTYKLSQLGHDVQVTVVRAVNVSTTRRRVSGVARPLVALCGCQIFRPFIFRDTGDPTQPYS